MNDAQKKIWEAYKLMKARKASTKIRENKSHQTQKELPNGPITPRLVG